MGQVARHRPLAEEQRGGDLAVRPALGDQGGDAALGGRQPLLARAPADAAELVARLRGPGRPPRAARSRRAPPRSRRGRRASAVRACGRCRARAARGRARRDRRPPRAARPPARRREAACSTSPCGGGDEAAAARHVREHPLAADPRRVRLPGVEDPHGVVDPAELEQRLDVVGAPPADARLAPAERRGLPVGLVEPLGGRGASPLQSATSPRTAMCCGGWSAELLLGQLEGPLRVRAGELELAAMDGDDRDRKVVLRHLEPVLDRDVVCARGVVGRELPAPGPELDPGEAPERARAPRLVALAPLLVLALEQAREPRPAWRHGARCSRPPASPPARAARRRRRSAKSCARAAELPAPPRRRRTSRGRPAPRERAPRSASSSSSSASSSAARACSSAREPFLKRVAHARRQWMTDLSAGPRRRLAQRFLEQRDRTVDALELGEEDEGLGAQRADLRLGQQLGRDRPRARPLPGRLMRPGRRQRPATALVARVRRRQPERLLGELGRDGRRAAIGRQRRGVVERPRRRRRRARPSTARGDGRGGAGRRRSPRCVA